MLRPTFLQDSFFRHLPIGIASIVAAKPVRFIHPISGKIVCAITYARLVPQSLSQFGDHVYNSIALGSTPYIPQPHKQNKGCAIDLVWSIWGLLWTCICIYYRRERHSSIQFDPSKFAVPLRRQITVFTMISLWNVLFTLDFDVAEACRSQWLCQLTLQLQNFHKWLSQEAKKQTAKFPGSFRFYVRAQSNFRLYSLKYIRSLTIESNKWYYVY